MISLIPYRSQMQNGGCQGLAGWVKFVLNRVRVSVGEDNEVLEMDGGGGYTTM